MLFNPVRKKSYKNLPEERVRLSEVNRLLQEGHSKALIQTENAIAHQTNDRLRSDIVVYDRNGKAQILVECKAPSVELNEAVLAQSFRYNQSLKAREVRISNSRQCVRFVLEDGQFMSSPLPETEARLLDRTHWERCGFLGRQTDETHISIILDQIEKISKYGLPLFWLDCPPMLHAADFTENASYFFADPSDQGIWHAYFALPSGQTRRLLLDGRHQQSTLWAINLPSDDKKASFYLLDSTGWQEKVLETPIETILTLQGGKDFLLYAN